MFFDRQSSANQEKRGDASLGTVFRAPTTPDSGYLSGNWQAFVCGPVQVAMALPVRQAEKEAARWVALVFSRGGGGVNLVSIVLWT